MRLIVTFEEDALDGLDGVAAIVKVGEATEPESDLREGTVFELLRALAGESQIPRDDVEGHAASVGHVERARLRSERRVVVATPLEGARARDGRAVAAGHGEPDQFVPFA